MQTLVKKQVKIKICPKCGNEYPTFRTKYCSDCTEKLKYQKTQKYQIELVEKEYGPLYKAGTYLFYHKITGTTFNISCSKWEEIKQKFFPYLYNSILYFQLVDQKGNKQNTFIKDNNIKLYIFVI